MSDEQAPNDTAREDPLLSVDQVAGLDAFLNHLAADRRPSPHNLTDAEAAERMLAAQMRLAREGVEEPTPAFLQALEHNVVQAIQREHRANRSPGVGRGRFLRAAAGAAAAVGLAGAGFEADEIQRRLRQPQELVGQTGRWYDIAGEHDVLPGGALRFTAGGVEGYLLHRHDGRLHAISAICTHMGCRLKLPAGGTELRCLCHSSRFSTEGQVLSGLAPAPLPRIRLEVEQGRVWAWGTVEDV